MAACGKLPSKLKDCPIPVFLACLFGKQTKQPWRGKQKQNRQRTLVANKPGDIVLVNVLDLSVPGFVGQMRGNLTTKQYTKACMFVDKFSGLIYTHLLINKTAADLVAAKKAFLQYSKQHGVQVRHIHADNGIFDAKEF